MSLRPYDLLQVHAFKSIYNQLLRIGEKSIEECFSEAIVVTSDDYFKKILLEKSKLIERWLKKYDEKKKNKKEKANSRLEFVS